MPTPPLEYRLTIRNGHPVIAYTRTENLFRAIHSEEDLNEFLRSEAIRYGVDVEELKVINEPIIECWPRR
jgi:hypothetical protein